MKSNLISDAEKVVKSLYMSFYGWFFLTARKIFDAIFEPDKVYEEVTVVRLSGKIVSVKCGTRQYFPPPSEQTCSLYYVSESDTYYLLIKFVDGLTKTAQVRNLKNFQLETISLSTGIVVN